MTLDLINSIPEIWLANMLSVHYLSIEGAFNLYGSLGLHMTLRNHGNQGNHRNRRNQVSKGTI